jgi:hypothetical protein
MTAAKTTKKDETEQDGIGALKLRVRLTITEEALGTSSANKSCTATTSRARLPTRRARRRRLRRSACRQWTRRAAPSSRA